MLYDFLANQKIPQWVWKRCCNKIQDLCSITTLCIQAALEAREQLPPRISRNTAYIFQGRRARVPPCFLLLLPGHKKMHSCISRSHEAASYSFAVLFLNMCSAVFDMPECLDESREGKHGAVSKGTNKWCAVQKLPRLQGRSIARWIKQTKAEMYILHFDTGFHVVMEHPISFTC